MFLVFILKSKTEILVWSFSKKTLTTSRAHIGKIVFKSKKSVRNYETERLQAAVS